ncbi:ABC transporter ATP-binding protein [Gordonia sp. (in: high G+C Gram-positive bacteria)]|jgi:ABC-2 type transport system ATP-binding protein|uniref:ABC transporter ATP-binding protein n=1 Tax=Gordonia sp. (in: high G+C Gram-positive bacteria) TaxID=84139 RepID=UPI001D2BD357|nr:ABC transporter ATP-binding protein [Gordonia sp. (in: high G+C Gram-positive bacteria)]MCB1295869.1 ABC transporter ATP-binding protein [Gordonia sp. (in: high G+C Gram-positive bacteria)]HMS76294.1 ABC transporter ATP-binding protein [Gordonia sp. (in: high G+C Gram-positive bacteria)]
MINTPAIALTDLRKSFRGPGDATITAVDGIGLTIAPGEVVAFLGPNGAGKTTTLDMVLGLTTPDSGTVRIYGTSPREATANGRIAAVLQNGGLHPDFTVAETVEIVASLHGRLDDVGTVLHATGLTGLAGRKVSRCSGGEQQRIKFALATLPDPDLLILDEPTAGMDVDARRAFWATMRTDAAAGRTVLFATHYLEEADTFADRIVLIAGGRIVADGPTADIRTMAGRRVVSAIVDDDEIARLTGRLPGVEIIEYRGGRTYLAAPDSDVLARSLLTTTGAREVEIASHNLEDAFLTLTAGTSGTRS